MNNQASKKLYALLVGINQYLGVVPQLNGCVNDVMAMRQFLEGRTQGGDFQLDCLVLTSSILDDVDEIKPTRKVVIDAFRNHMGKARQDDIALFYYSGHGSQEKAPWQFWDLEPDHLDETIVCYDSRTEGGWDLVDKELALLIAEVAANSPEILVILDSCHSGSGTRAAEGLTERLAPQDLRDRPLDTFLPGVIKNLPTGSPTEQPVTGEINAGGWLTLPHGRHVVIAACQPEQSAREKGMPDGQVHGIFSYYFLDSLQQSGPGLTYRDLFNRTRNLVGNQVRDQNPYLAATQMDDLKRTFLSGAIIPQPVSVDVFYDESVGTWFIRAGSIHGIQSPSGEERTFLKVFAFDQVIQVGDLIDSAIGDAEVMVVEASRSMIQLTMKDGTFPSHKDTFKAIVTSLPLLPVTVHISGDDLDSVKLLAEKVNQSKIIRHVEDVSAASLRAIANLKDSDYRLQRTGNLKPLLVSAADKGTASSANEAVAKLEHMAQWTQVLELENKMTQMPEDAVIIEFYRVDPQTKALERIDQKTPMRLQYDLKKGEQEAYFRIRLVRPAKYKSRVFCMLIDLTETFAVVTDQALFGGGVWLEPDDAGIWATTADGDRDILAYIPDEMRNKGLNQVTDWLKLIVCTEESDAFLLGQSDLEVVVDDSTRGLKSTRGIPDETTLNRLMLRLQSQTRAVGSRPKPAKLSDWRTFQIELVVECLGESRPIPTQKGKKEKIADGISIDGHPELKGKIELVSFDEGKRDIGNLSLPAVFRDNPGLTQPFDFLPSRGLDSGYSVLRLSELVNPQAVTPEAPLRIQAETHLQENEVVLPLGFDPVENLFLPLGIGYQEGNQVSIQVDHLPGPTADSRDLAGSIKLFFQKVIADKVGIGRFGLEGKTHRLAVAWMDDLGKAQYDESPISLRQKVQAADRILLLMHGIFGDTRGMVTSAFGVPGDNTSLIPRLVDQYDLILAFDYENIYTPVEETVTELRKSLVEAGLVAGHGKHLHIVAHSLGSMVTRYFIERDQGNAIVEKAVLVGPPNNGTPWAKIEDYAIIGIAAAMNGVVALVSPPAAIASLVGTLVTVVKGTESFDRTLDQVQPGSDFYKVLDNSPDPGIPYAVVAGNTSKIKYASADSQKADVSVLKKLVDKLASPKTRNQVLSLAFLNAPNDMAISTKSMVNLPEGRQPAAELFEAACDHMSYFNTREGLEKIIQALG